MDKGELWVVSFPLRKGREQSGNRPAVIMADTMTDIVLAVPLTSNLQALEEFSFTLVIRTSQRNQLYKDSVALIFQLQAVDKKRLVHKMGNLEDSDLEQINKKLRDLLKL